MTNNASCLLPSGVARWRIVNSFDCTPFCEFFHNASDGTAWLNIKIGAKNHDDYCHVSERAVEYFLKHNGLVEGLEPLDTGSFSLSVARFACADPHNGWKTLGCRTPSLACPSNHGFSIPTLNATFAAATRSDRLSHHWNPPESSPSTKLIEQLIKEVMVLHLLPQSSTVGEEKEESRRMLRWAALFLGELRDGLTMINMQSAFLIVSRNYSEKQAGVLFFVFGMSQFLFQTPAGYLYDYTERKLLWLTTAAVATTFLTVCTAAFATDYGGNLKLMVFIKFIQGAVTSFIPPGLNSITQGIVGAPGMTSQVSVNEMMNHLGTAIIVLTGSVLGVLIYPNLGWLFIVSPVACCGFVYFLNKIRKEDIDHDAARGLLKEPKSTLASPSREYHAQLKDSIDGSNKGFDSRPSFNFGWQSVSPSLADPAVLHADTPWKVLRDPVLLTFIVIVFLFHAANGTVLPLVMQTLALDSGRTGILMSGLCIIVAQVFMVLTAKICGDYSGKYGRKGLFLIGLFSVPIRCLILTLLLQIRGNDVASSWLQFLILSTQILDGVGAGSFGTMYILVTSDISGGTGRFAMTLGLTTAAMSIGGTVSGYFGEALAQDLGYEKAFFILMFMALVPALSYLLFMPETLPLISKTDAFPRSIGSIKEEEDHEEPHAAQTSYAELT